MKRSRCFQLATIALLLALSSVASLTQTTKEEDELADYIKSHYVKREGDDSDARWREALHRDL